MGNGVGLKRRGSSRSSDEKSSPQDEAMSFRGKCSAMKTILHTDGSKIAVMKYFRGTESESYLNYYFEVEDIKTCLGAVFIQKVLDLRDRYNPQRNAQQSDVKLDIWENIESFVADEEQINEGRAGEIMTLLKFSQTYVISVLASFLDDFLTSKFYTDWEKGMQTAERENILKKSASVSKPKTELISTPTLDLCIQSKYKQILLADDSAVTTKITSAMLMKAGFSVTKASHGRDVLNLLTSEQSFGLAIIDLYMPILDGFEAVETFRNSLRKGRLEDDKEIMSSKSMATNISVNDDVCIIGMSADENLATRNRAFASGVDYFLQKPFTMEKFFDILRDLHGGVPSISINRAASGVMQKKTSC